MDPEALERWIDARLLEYQELTRSGTAGTPEDFVERATAEEPLRVRLRERLRLLRRLESGFALLREEPVGPGTELGDFEVLEEIGAGGMGRVFRARQRSVGRWVAIKVAHRGSAMEPGPRQRFLREAQAVAGLHHPNIVQLHQVGEHQGAPFLVFELCDGRSLRALLADLVQGRAARTGESLGRPGESFERAAVGVLLSVLDALVAAHEAGIVHRDIKPGNVLLERDGRVRVVDFGLARSVDQDTLTDSRELIGTLSYMAPEVVRSPHAAGPWSDVWSAGVVLHELLALRRPFEGQDALQILQRIESAEVTPLHASHGIARLLSAIVEKALSREIGQRYSSAREMALDLRAWLEGREVSARPSTLWTRAGRRLNRHPGLTAVSVALALALALLAGAWRSRGEVRAQVRLTRAEVIAREGLLWWYADAGPGGRPSNSIAGRTHAIERLEEALREAPQLVEARVELAQYSAMASRDQRALELIDGLEAEGLRLRCLEWTRALVRDPDRARPRPDPEETLDLAGVADLDRLAWARHLLQEYQGDLAMEVLRPIEEHPILGPAARYVQFEACNTRGRRDPTLAIGSLEAASMVSPGHPLVLANLVAVHMERLLALASDPGADDPSQRQVRSNLEAELEGLLPRLAQAEAAEPWFAAAWLNHVALLGRLGRLDEAAEIARAGLRHHPGDGSLTDQLAQTYYSRWNALAGDVPLPQAELEELRRLLEVSLETPPILPQNLYNLTYVHHLRDDREATLVWGERALREYLDQAPANATTDRQRANCRVMLDWAREAPAGVESK
jgi:tetratricopeptide (TPR) repeat protein